MQYKQWQSTHRRPHASDAVQCIKFWAAVTSASITRNAQGTYGCNALHCPPLPSTHAACMPANLRPHSASAPGTRRNAERRLPMRTTHAGVAPHYCARYCWCDLQTVPKRAWALKRKHTNSRCVTRAPEKSASYARHVRAELGLQGTSCGRCKLIDNQLHYMRIPAHTYKHIMAVRISMVHMAVRIIRNELMNRPPPASTPFSALV